MRREPGTSGMNEAQNHELVECFPVLSCVSCELGRHKKKGQGRAMTPTILPFQERSPSEFCTCIPGPDPCCFILYFGFACPPSWMSAQPVRYPLLTT